MMERYKSKFNEMAKNSQGSYTFKGKITVIEDGKKQYVPIEASIYNNNYIQEGKILWQWIKIDQDKHYWML